MRTTWLGLVFLTVLTACGDDAPQQAEPDAGTTATKDEPPPAPEKRGMSPEEMAKVAERMKRTLDKGNRMPGMPNETLTGDPKSALEAARRISTAKLGTFTDDEAVTFLQAAREILGADKADHPAIIQKHGLTQMRYRMIESLFKRSQGIGPDLSALEKKLVAPWLEKWRNTVEVK